VAALGKILDKQPINRRVIYALVPCVLGGVYYFGWRSLAMVLWAAVVGFVCEFIFTRHRGERVSEAVFVTTTIFALIMPPTVSFWVVTVGVVFAIIMSKEIFGGYRYNVFNPAMAGRCFVYICFPVALTGTWGPAAEGPMGALGTWTTAPTADAITGATPMANLKAGKLELGGEGAVDEVPFDIGEGEQVTVSRWAMYKGLLLGRISGTMGVTSVVLILIGGMYLFYTKTANRSIILSLIITYAVLNQVLHWFGVEPIPGALPAVLGGGFLFGAFYMATDPISAPKTPEAKIAYGVLIGTFTTVIRNFSIFNGGLMFSILIGNMFAPIMDHGVRAYKKGRKAGKAKGGGDG
jgi:Na+-transporting NADH:ubiquinone oxidoreductase subunit B